MKFKAAVIAIQFLLKLLPIKKFNYHPTILGTGIIILRLRIDYSTITEKLFIILRLMLDHSTIIEKRIYYSTSRGRSSYHYGNKGLLFYA